MLFDFKNEDILKLIKESDTEKLELLCDDMRDFLLDKVSKTGGHLASNLGVVELTVALHKVYDSPRDKIIFDVGHQSYVHKIITGRGGDFDTLRQYKGLSGFPKARESVHDAYDTGHSTTSLGAALGMAVARDLKNEDFNVVAIIGDGSMTGGLAYEALNNIGTSGTNVKIILNDNGMSIAKNVGAMSKHLSDLRSSQKYINTKSTIRTAVDRIPVVGRSLADNISKTKDKIKYSVINDTGILFEEMGIKYIGPVDGYDIDNLIDAFEDANAINGPTIVHVATTKGKGYRFAERYPRKFHGVGPFDVDNGKLLSETSAPSMSKVFGRAAVDLAAKDERVIAISAAMGTATGLGEFYKQFPERYFDVGIAEQHAVLFAAGLAKEGMIPIVAIYSSFLQRAYDQIVEDVCLQDLHVIFAIDRAGLVGADGETHHGQFDLSYLNTVPNMTVLAPADGHQLTEMMEYAYTLDGPVAIRYPRGSSEFEHLRLKEFTGENITISEGKDITILAAGNMLDTAIETAEILRPRGFDIGIVNVCVVKPYDTGLNELDTRLAITIEDNSINGGFGEMFAAHSVGKGYDVLNFALPDRFIEHGSVSELRQECGLTPSDIAKGALDLLEGKA